jgi:VanZ family protein
MWLPASASAWKPWVRIAIWCVGILVAQSGVSSDLAHNILGWVTGVSSDSGPGLHFAAQKIFHVLLFGGVGALVPLPSTRAGWTRVLVGCLVISVGGEMIQMMSPGRTPRITDTVLNVAACFVPLYWRARRRRVASSGFEARISVR